MADLSISTAPRGHPLDKSVAYSRALIVFLALLYAATFSRDVIVSLLNANGLLLADGISAAGGDFINMFSAGALAAAGKAAAAYDPAALKAFQATLIPANIGVRLWVYPPTSLPFAIPFAAIGFWPGLLCWSILGSAVLAFGARRAGLSWLEAGLLVISPASLNCLQVGQTGNLAAGLLLIALTSKGRFDGGSAIAAALLTIKPQLGPFIPVLWVMQRKLKLVAVTLVLAAALVGLSILLFGWQSWVGYVTQTLPVLVSLERHGEGPFVAMIPSVFMAVRILTGDPGLAQWVHAAVAATILVVVTLRLKGISSAAKQTAVLLMATALVTPYLHIYDLTIVFAALLLHARRLAEAGARVEVQLLGAVATIVAWGMPTVTVFGNVFDIPFGPLTLLALMAVVAWPVATHSKAAAAA